MLMTSSHSKGNPMPGGHAWSADGITWSNMSGCNGAYALDGCFNLTRPYKAANGSLLNISYYTERPKLLLAADRTPTHLYGTVYWPIPNEKREKRRFHNRRTVRQSSIHVTRQNGSLVYSCNM